MAPKEANKPQTQLGKKISKKAKLYNQQRELSWDEEDRRHLVLKNLFDPTDPKYVRFLLSVKLMLLLQKDPKFYEELKEDLQTECETFGEVEKIKVFERHPEGIAILMFEQVMPAKKCLQKMDGRWFGGRQLSCDFYDGWTDYAAEELPEDKSEEQKRIDEFGDWLEKED